MCVYFGFLESKIADNINVLTRDNSDVVNRSWTLIQDGVKPRFVHIIVPIQYASSIRKFLVNNGLDDRLGSNTIIIEELVFLQRISSLIIN